MEKVFEGYSLYLIESLVVIFVWMVLRFVLSRIVNKRLKLTDFSAARKRITLKSVYAVINLILFGALISIWSVDQKEILVFFSSMVTVLGVAFFAQWSHLSNITSGIIIFFNTATKIGDDIRIMDKDFDIEGEIMDIGMMFFKIKNSNNEIISIPNNIILQKAIKTNDKRLTASIFPTEEGSD